MTSYSIDLETGKYTSATSKERTNLSTVIAQIYKASECYLFSSGLNAIYVILSSLAIHYVKGTFLISKDVYSPTLSRTVHLLRKQYPAINFKVIDINHNPKIHKICNSPKTKVLFLEWCSNPEGFIFDQSILDSLPEHAYCVVDNTWLTPYNFNPLQYNRVDCVLESTAKYWSAGQCPAGFGVFKREHPLNKLVKNAILSMGIHVTKLYCQIIQDNIPLIETHIQRSAERMQTVLNVVQSHSEIVKIFHPSIHSPDNEFKYIPGTVLFFVRYNNVNKRTYPEIVAAIKHCTESHNMIFITSYGHKFDSINSYPDVGSLSIGIRMSRDMRVIGILQIILGDLLMI